MASNTSTTKGIECETTKAKGVQEEIKVDTVDYRSSAGQEEKKEEVQVIHEVDSGGDKGGVLAGAAKVVTDTIKSAKDAIPSNKTKQ